MPRFHNPCPFCSAGSIKRSKLLHLCVGLDIVSWMSTLAMLVTQCSACSEGSLRHVTRHAELLCIRSPRSNPCVGMRRHKCEFKAVYLNASDYDRLGSELGSQVKDWKVAVALIRFIALTGFRLSEERLLLWDHIEGGAGCSARQQYRPSGSLGWA